MKDETYYFHQTPQELCKELIKIIPFDENDKVLEPFKGEGSFYNNLPTNVEKDFCEIEEGLNYKDYDKEIDWVVSNPPFKLETDSKRVNSFYYLIKYYASRVKKGVAFLGNDFCFATLTPIRLKELNETHGLYIHKIIVSNIKKWRGRYFFIIFRKQPCEFYNYIEGNF
jgi:type I restriction-modification system DNA methylase subunit